ncbi:PJA2 ligase, partial [Climacteris rufus]|nr:PJA2 ligase [Climacteris rufus]
MGQGAGKNAWPRRAGEYQTGRRRRWGRHSFHGCRPLLNSQDSDAHQQNEDCNQLKLEDVQKKDFLCISSLSVQASTGLSDEPLSKQAGTREPVCQSVSSQPSEGDTSPLSLYCYGPEGNQTSNDCMSPCENFEDLAEHKSEGCNDLKGKSGITLENIDSCEPDSSDGEEDDTQDRYSWLTKAAGLLQGRLNNIVSRYEKVVDSLTDLQSQLTVVNPNNYRQSWEEAEPMPLSCLNSKTFKSAEDQAIPKSSLSGASYETQQIKHTVDVGFRTPVPTGGVLNISGEDTDQENSGELVVRPKIRKQNTIKLLERENCFLTDDEDESDSWKRTGNANVHQCHLECPLRDGKEEMSSGMSLVSRVHGDQKNTKTDLRRNAAAQEQNNVLRDSPHGYECGDCSRRCLTSQQPNDEDSSECSDGEWSMATPSNLTGMKKAQTSSDESSESVPCREECCPKVQSSSGVKEENTDCCFQEREKTVLEEGEIPWLQYQEEVQSSSDEESDTVSDFMSFEFLLLDGNNNLDDDSSSSEDLDVEWRYVMFEFGESLELAQDISYMGPQFFTFMALQGHLEAMEIALGHMGSVTPDAEHTHPPATQETIVCLPHIIVKGDRKGQEQCCPICCSEYVDGETITELPCHHLFHKPCVTRWLQRSGTCPVCRHVLAPAPPEAADDTA